MWQRRNRESFLCRRIVSGHQQRPLLPLPEAQSTRGGSHANPLRGLFKHGILGRIPAPDSASQVLSQFLIWGLDGAKNLYF